MAAFSLAILAIGAMFLFSGGEIGHSSVGTWFKSGTMELKDDGKTLIFDVTGTLQDGRAFTMNITTDSKKFE